MPEVLQEPWLFPSFHILSPSHLFPTQLPGHALRGPKRSGGFRSPSEGRGRPCHAYQAVHSLGWHPLLFAPSHPCTPSHRPPGWLSCPASNAPTWALAYPFCCRKNPEGSFPLSSGFFQASESLPDHRPHPLSPGTEHTYCFIYLGLFPLKFKLRNVEVCFAHSVPSAQNSLGSSSCLVNTG